VNKRKRKKRQRKERERERDGRVGKRTNIRKRKEAKKSIPMVYRKR
jgi:hypothetical protein